VYLSSNAITLPISYLSSPVLNEVDLSRNNITATPSTIIVPGTTTSTLLTLIQTFARSNYLNLAYNRIQLPWALGQSGNMLGVDTLILSNNGITSIHPDFMTSALTQTLRICGTVCSSTPFLVECMDLMRCDGLCCVAVCLDLSNNAIVGSGFLTSGVPSSNLDQLILTGNKQLVGPALPSWVCAATPIRLQPILAFSAPLLF
jgi:hypothetical protein